MEVYHAIGGAYFFRMLVMKDGSKPRLLIQTTSLLTKLHVGLIKKKKEGGFWGQWPPRMFQICFETILRLTEHSSVHFKLISLPHNTSINHQTVRAIIYFLIE